MGVTCLPPGNGVRGAQRHLTVLAEYSTRAMHARDSTLGPVTHDPTIRIINPSRLNFQGS